MANFSSSTRKLIETVTTKNRKPLKSFWRTISRRSRALKLGSTTSEEKNALWSIQAFADGTEFYLSAYRLMAQEKYYDGWCVLEQAELAFARLVNNSFVKELEPLTQGRVDLVALWQSLFPYRYFASPGMRYIKWSCSICGKQSSPVEPCGHVVLRVYDGELCFRIIHEADPTHIAIVTNPVQKYSVFQLDYDYSVVRYVIGRLTGPFHPWDGKWTYKRHPHVKFSDRPKNGACPCESKLRYSECCLLEAGVRLPHFQMTVGRGATRAGSSNELLVLRPPRVPAINPTEQTYQVNLLKVEH